MKNYMAEDYFEKEQFQEGIVGFNEVIRFNVEKFFSTYKLTVVSCNPKRKKLDNGNKRVIDINYKCRLDPHENVDYEALNSSISHNFGHIINLAIRVPAEETDVNWLGYRGPVLLNNVYDVTGTVAYGTIYLKASGILVNNDVWIGDMSKKPELKKKENN